MIEAAIEEIPKLSHILPLSIWRVEESYKGDGFVRFSLKRTVISSFLSKGRELEVTYTHVDSPQVKNGYIRIANAIWKAFGRYRLSGEEWMVLNCILYKTYGFNKKEDKISISQFYEYTGMKKPSIIRALKKLVDKNIVSKKANATIPSYCFNKLFTTWKSLAKKLIVSTFANGVSTFANQTGKKRKYTKKRKNTTKDNVTKDRERASKNYLLKIPETDVKEFLKNFKVSESQIISKGKGLFDYCTSRGKLYKNYKAFMRNALRSDFGERQLQIKKGLSDLIPD